MNRAEKRTGSLEERACRLKAVPVEIKLLTVPGGSSTMVRDGSVIDLPGGARFRLPRIGLLAGALIVLQRHFYWVGDPVPHLPDPGKEIARQKAQGKKFIVVDVPWKIEEET